jgi:predicted MFS family arabinose efflux permease
MSYIQDLYEHFTGFPRTVKLFYCADIFYGFAGAIFSTLFNLHMLAVGFTADHIGRLQTLSSLVIAVLAIPVGLAADRWGRRWFYVAGSLLFGVPYMVMPWLTSFPAMLGIWVLYSVANVLMFVNESPLLAGEVGPDRRATVFSFMMINFFVWNTLGVQLAGFLSTWLPRGALSQFQWPLVIAGVMALVSGGIRSFLPFKPQAPAKRRLNLRPTRTTVLLGLVSVVSGGFTALLINFNNVILAQRFGFQTEYLATVLTISGVVGWLGSLAVPWTSHRLGDLKAFTLVVGLQSLVLIVMGFIGTPALFLTALWTRSVLYTMQMSLWNALAMGVTPEGERATAASYALVGRNLGNAGTSKVFGAALTGGHYLFSFGLSGVLALAAALLTLLAFARHRLFESGSEGVS